MPVMENNTMDGRKLKHEVLTELRKRPVAQVQSGKSSEIVVLVSWAERPFSLQLT
jgi:hypothetical protein